MYYSRYHLKSNMPKNNFYFAIDELQILMKCFFLVSDISKNGVKKSEKSCDSRNIG